MSESEERSSFSYGVTSGLMFNIATSEARSDDESEPEGRTERAQYSFAELCLQSVACEPRSEDSELAKSPSEERAAREAQLWPKTNSQC